MATSRGENDAEAPLLDRSDNKEQRLQQPTAGEYGLGAVARFATRADLARYALGVVCACVFGAVLPLQSIILGRIFGGTSGIDPQALRRNILANIPHLLQLGAVAFASGYLQHVLLIGSAERVVQRLRAATMASLLRQEVSYFDERGAGALGTVMADRSQALLRGLGESVGMVALYTSQMASGFWIAFSMNAQVATALLVVVPANTLVVGVMVALIISFVNKINSNNEKAGSFAEDVLSAMQTVASVCAQPLAIARYRSFMDTTNGLAKKVHLVHAVGVGAIYVLVFTSYGLGYWWGSRVIADMRGGFGDVLSAVFSCVIGSIAIAVAMPNVRAVVEARAAAGDLLCLVDRRPVLLPGRGLRSPVAGNIEFREVSFKYPNRDQTVLGRVNFTVRAGTTTALVGPSGTGKSTCVALLERFYDATSGLVLVDGVDVRDYDIAYLRSQIALVSQEPVLFAADIKDNILMGGAQPDALEGDYVAAAKAANAHDFITAFPDRYATWVGPRGAQLSGGQKQRIAIARALVRRPRM